LADKSHWRRIDKAVLLVVLNISYEKKDSHWRVGGSGDHSVHYTGTKHFA
jgi:hypothetical protein